MLIFLLAQSAWSTPAKYGSVGLGPRQAAPISAPLSSVAASVRPARPRAPRAAQVCRKRRRSRVGMTIPFSAIAGAVEQLLGGGNVLGDAADRQRVGLELAHRVERRVVGGDTGHDRPFVVAVGEIALRFIAGQV